MHITSKSGSKAAAQVVIQHSQTLPIFLSPERIPPIRMMGGDNMPDPSAIEASAS